MRFSERYGHRPVRTLIQLESMDDALRNGLWSVLYDHVCASVIWTSGISPGRYISHNSNGDHWQLARRLWLDFFKRPIDTLKYEWSDVEKTLRDYFFTKPWDEVYDVLEFVGLNYPKARFRDPYYDACNRVLEREMSGYRFVNGLITRIIDEAEIQDVETAIEESSSNVGSHLRRALELMSDRTSPDYRNSIKESISAVEALVIAATGKRGTFGDLLKKLDADAPVALHPALRTAFSNLYGYTSDESGVRHALLEKDRVDFDEAKFMIVVCSAFVNFVTAKKAHAGHAKPLAMR